MTGLVAALALSILLTPWSANGRSPPEADLGDAREALETALVALPSSAVANIESDRHWLWRNFAGALSGALHFIGGMLPLRGLASLAADLGVPGADSALQVLT